MTTQPTPALDAQDLSRLSILMTGLDRLMSQSQLDLGDVVVYDDGEPLGTITCQDGKMVLKSEA